MVTKAGDEVDGVKRGQDRGNGEMRSIHADCVRWPASLSLTATCGEGLGEWMHERAFVSASMHGRTEMNAVMD